MKKNNLDYLFVYTTFPNQTVGEESAGEAIKKGYAACANLISNITSLYQWKGKIQTNKEVVVVFKTIENKYKLLENLLKSTHPYECPCIVAIVIKDGNADFLSWISSNTLDKKK